MDENVMNECPEMEEPGSGLVATGGAKKSGRGIHAGLRAVGNAARRIGARNIVIVCSLMLIGAAVILNFVLFGNSQPVVGDGDPLGEGGSFGEVVESNDTYVEDTYFASAQLSRKQARDEAIAVLQTVVSSSTADSVSKEQATADISRIASEMQTEANIETLIKSKGFEDCVAVISDNSASVIVCSDGLLPNELSQIKEIVWEQAGIDPVNIKIIEKNPA
ncbi:MAG: SpoIIIAH-like family protein [Clostridia bacterium]|nr:SpoIIIAH-like family protein [Clostridia bacterium]